LKSLDDLAQYTGVISSKVFGTSRNTFGDIETFIKNDIIRSLTTRMQIYYDALLANDDGGNDDESGQDQDVNSTIPPRRVFYPIGNGNILFGDYLFQNETEDTTVKQSMDILSISLKPKDVITKAEAIVHLETSSSQEKSENVSNDEPLSTKDTGKLLLIVGIVGALIALLVAIILHFVLK
jgi:Odorant response abnormal 4-like